MADPNVLRARLRARVVVDLAGCWIWQGAADPAGYGAIKLDGKKRNAHKVSFEAFGGVLEPKQIVCHRCHNPACINPEHLYAGSRKQNLADAAQAGRCNGAKLTPGQVRAIRRDKRAREVIAARYGIAHSTVNKIKAGTIHKEVR